MPGKSRMKHFEVRKGEDTMAGRPPKPIDVVLLDGKKHLTKAEIEAH